jgi:hypothetical protein
LFHEIISYKKLQVKASALSQDELEDLGMSKLMHEVDKSKKVSRAEIMKKLFNNSFRQVCS